MLNKESAFQIHEALHHLPEPWIGLGIALLLLLVIIGHAVLTEWYCIPMGKDDIVLMDLYQTSDGMIHIILCRRQRLISPLRHRS